MPRIHKQIEINAPVNKVYEFIEDPAKDPEWMTNMVEVKDVKGSGLGMRFKWTWNMAGFKLKGETVNVEDVPNRKIVVNSTGGIESTWAFAFEPKGDATVLDLDIDYRVPVPVLGRLAEKVLLKHNERDAEMALMNLKERLES